MFPLQVAPGQKTLFSYFLRPATTQDGFDQIAIEATTAPRFDAAFVDGESVEVTTESLAEGFRATFPRRIRSRQLVELRFTAPVYVQATRFDAFLEDSQKAQVRQLVDPGDAAPQVESSSNVVRLPIADQLFAGLLFSPALITPNGDGISDQLLVSFDLINVLSARPLHLRLYDLSGRLLFAQEQEGRGLLEFSRIRHKSCESRSNIQTQRASHTDAAELAPLGRILHRLLGQTLFIRFGQ